MSACSPSPQPIDSTPAGTRRCAHESADWSTPARPSRGAVRWPAGPPPTLSWVGAVNGHRVRPLGVEHFGQTGSLPDLYKHFGIDANAIIAAAQAIAPGRPIRHLRALG